MICPRWLVQSSAASVVLGVLIAAPMWAAPRPPAEAATLMEGPPDRVRVVEVISDEVVHSEESIDVRSEKELTKQVVVGPTKVLQKREARRTHLRHRDLRAEEVRNHLREIYPQCPTVVRPAEPEAMKEARSAVEVGHRRAIERTR
jgi:hypothetical protein